MSKKISVTVSDELHAELKAYAKWKGETTIAGFLREAACQYMRRYAMHKDKHMSVFKNNSSTA